MNQSIEIYERERPSAITEASWSNRVAAWEHVAASPAFQRICRRLVEVAEPSPDDRIVDLGAGTGLLSLALAGRVDSVVAVDFSQAMLDRMLERSRRDGIRNIRPVAADLRSLPLADHSATLVVSNYAFHHLPDSDKEIALAEARRVLAPGGRLLVCDMMFSLSLAPRDRKLLWSKVSALARRGPAGMLRIASNGFRVVRGRWEHPAPPDRWHSMLEARHFVDISIELLEHEAGLARASRPPADAA